MSELLQSATKDYLFLTMKQYNDEEKLKRAEVQVRRDQPFFEGGNSYVCCESFRITAAPSMGAGIYYTKLNSTEYLGTHRDTTAVPIMTDQAEANANWVECRHNWGVGNSDELYADQLEELGAGNEAVIAMRLRLCSLKQSDFPRDVTQGGATGTGVSKKKTGDFIRKSLLSYLSGSEIHRDTVLRVQCPAGAKPGAGANPNAGKWIVGTITNDPTHETYGYGLGHNKLFMPQLYMDQMTAETAAKLTTGTKTANLTFYIPASITAKILTEIDVNEFLGMVRHFASQGTFMERTDDHDRPDDEMHNGAWFEVLGPSVPHLVSNSDIVDANGLLKVPISTLHTVDTFQGGTYVHGWKTVNSNGLATGYTEVAGMASFSDQWCSYTGGVISIKLRVRLSQALQAMSSADMLKIVDRAKLGNAMFTMSSMPFVQQLQVYACVQMKVNYYDNTAANDGSVALPINDINTLGYGMLSLNRPDIKAYERIIRRGSNNSQNPKVVYTPNELFRKFNRSPSDGEDLPWKLQTDVNGGFQVIWDTTFTNEFADFMISEPLLQKLGLDNYMTYEREAPAKLEPSDSNEQIFVTLRPSQSFNADLVTSLTGLTDGCETMTMEAFENFMGWDPATDQTKSFIQTWVQYADNDAKKATLNPVSDGGFRELTRNNADGSQDNFEIVDVRPTGSKDHETIRQVISPTWATDKDGVKYHIYRNLPPKALLSNDSSLSVESISTFSGINIVSPNLPFQPQLGEQTDQRILCSLALPFEYSTTNDANGQVTATNFKYYGDLIWNTDSSRTYLKITTDQSLYDVTIQARLMKRDGSMEIMQLPYQGEFKCKLRFIQTQ